MARCRGRGVLPMFLHICEALEAAHARGVIHRDLKPSNCFRVRHATGDDFIKVCDFGLARIIDEELPGGLLAGGVLLATPEYMAPELIRGAKADPRVDIYGVGVLLYELLTGACPFSSGKQTAVLAMQLLDTPIPPRRVAPEANIPSSVERVIMRSLSKDPEDRFQSVAEMRAALLDDTRLHKLAPPPEPSSVRRRTDTMTRGSMTVPRARGGVGMTIALALVAAGLIGWVLAGTPGLRGADATADPAPVVPPVTTPAAALTPPPVLPTPTPRPDPEPEPHVPTPEDPEPEVPGVVSGVVPGDTPTPDVTPTPAEVPGKKLDGKKRPVDSEPDEPVNFDIEDDPGAPTEVSPGQIDEALRPLRPAASECGKKNGVPLGTDIGVKMLLASDGKLTNVRPTDRPASDPAIQCIVDLVKGAKIEQPGRSKFTSAFFDYSFKVY